MFHGCHIIIEKFEVFPLTLPLLVLGAGAGAGAGKSRPILGKSLSEPGQNGPGSPALIIPNLKLLGTLGAVVSLKILVSLGGVNGGECSPNVEIPKLSDK